MKKRDRLIEDAVQTVIVLGALILVLWIVETTRPDLPITWRAIIEWLGFKI